MTIKEIKAQLQTSDKPVAKLFHKGEAFKVLLFGFNKGMKLEEHTAKHPTKLLVLEGDVIYHQGKDDIRLKQYEEVDIPANMTHSVGALKDSIILLTQG
jgi:quercetin dioxygenase-like cupin family protein